jgi:peptidoglycan/LPS O-acetylase OafA/YrhL
VVLFHLNSFTLHKHMSGAAVQPSESWLPALLGAGYYGVELFFVLSGFLLAIPFAKWRLGLGTQPLLRTYYFRRLSRLEPPYILAMLVFFVGKMRLLGVPTGISYFPNLLATLIYQHNLIFGGPSVISIVAWSLEIEVQFYILAPLFATVYSIRNVLARRAILLSVILAAPLLRNFLPSYSAARFNSLPWYLEFFAAGFLLADIYLVDWKETPNRTFVWDLATLIAWPAVAALILWPRFPVLIAPAILLAYLGAFRGRASNRFFRHPLVTIIGGMCYSMYLIQGAAMWGAGELSKHFLFGSNFMSRFAIDSLFALPALSVSAALFFLLVERPCMDPAWPSKLAQRMRRWFGGAPQAHSNAAG